MGKLGRYITALIPIEEDRVLLGRLIPDVLRDKTHAGCLIGLARDFRRGQSKSPQVRADIQALVGHQFNVTVDRFDIERVGAAIRNRIIAKQAARQGLVLEPTQRPVEAQGG